jgi:chromosomal replication initiation ATPase DnaA
MTRVDDLSARVEELEAECIRLRRDMLAMHQAIRILRDGYQDNGGPADMRAIALRHAVKSGVTLAEMRGKGRWQPLAAARQDAMAEMHEAGFSTPQIGHYLGRRDHTTVLHGIAAANSRQSETPPG